MKDYPNTPGCYLFKDSDENIIYVGKAKNLKKRISSYFQKKDLDPKTGQLVKNISDVDFITTDNEVEALLLENTLIKKHKPKYNIDLKDSKRYAFLKLTDEKFPRLVTARTKDKDGKLFGPFVSGYERTEVQEALTRIFKIRTCRRFPKKPCLRYHIGLCKAPCVGFISEEEYASDIQKAELVLKGHIDDVSKKLESEMKNFSNNNDFEKAIERRNQISALENLKEKQKVERDKKYDEDIINYIIKDDFIYLMLFNVYKGTLANKNEFSFEYMDDFLEDFLLQYYDSNPIPKELILPEKIDNPVITALEKMRGKKLNITIPKIGEKKKLIDLVEKNIELSFFSGLKKTEALQKDLGLKFIPHVIECFDISHLGGTLTVGSMVSFKDGRPDKNDYRRFRIQSYVGNDDFSGIAEVVSRRYKRLRDEGKKFPDLIMIDGGKGQLSAALDSLQRLDLKIPMISIAKQEEEIFFPGSSKALRLPQKSKSLLFLREIRDEAHRFAITYNRLLRKKEIK